MSKSTLDNDQSPVQYNMVSTDVTYSLKLVSYPLSGIAAYNPAADVVCESSTANVLEKGSAPASNR